MSASLFESLLIFFTVAQKVPELNNERSRLAVVTGLSGRSKLDVELGISSVKLKDGHKLEAFVRCHSQENTIIASSYLGHPVAFAVAAAHYGVRTALVHDHISPFYENCLKEHNVRSINISSFERGPRDIINHAYQASDDGYIPVIVADAPSSSRTIARFLGQNVRFSNIIQFLAKMRYSRVLSIHNILGDVELEWFGEELAIEDNIQSQLIQRIENLTIANPGSYKWARETAFFTDPTFSSRLLQQLPDVKDWMGERQIDDTP